MNVTAAMQLCEGDTVAAPRLGFRKLTVCTVENVHGDVFIEVLTFEETVRRLRLREYDLQFVGDGPH